MYACVCTYTSRELINAAAVTDHDITDDDGGAVQVRASYSILHTASHCTTCSMPDGPGYVHRTKCGWHRTTYNIPGGTCYDASYSMLHTKHYFIIVPRATCHIPHTACCSHT